ncbi:MAG: hypothetical protein JXR83_23680 [Deltaproteobacteria bacterium]|nr:hypothetical protein [Deltaproteobacteria bacterium]
MPAARLQTFQRWVGTRLADGQLPVLTLTSGHERDEIPFESLSWWCRRSAP